ncbi:FG-GAP-like repeat-containing protein [Actinoallomurus soli]|uniref:FG-GAP-like repeat-containing protein n=1 Tax=Actinoallomurus soli TaxID=2952535 RepID=UPI002093C977|nr:FG-GAP-like repeat-containing protein [Actinoallomurus soli]MCO5967034.1 FG-GAP-like repeat-containing protein [Actinoallomurus soli]
MRILATGTIAMVTVAATAGLASAAVAAAPRQPVTPAGVRAAVKPAKPGDFNGDGYRDLAIGAPDAKVGTATKAGAVAVAYGSKNGLSTARRQVISQNSAGIPGTAEKGDHFGRQLAVGDFNRDGYSDLAIGAPGEDIGTKKDAGSLTIVFGSKNGLSTKAVAVDGVGGNTLTAGDFDKDGRTDFATAAVNGTKIWVIRGTTSATPRAVGISPGKDGEVDTLAAGDVTGDGYADLAVSWWWDDPADQGTTSVIAGSAKGLGKKVGPTIELGDTNDVAVGDLNKDGRADVVIGGYEGDGYRVYPGTRNGMDEAHGTTWTEGSDPVTVGDVNGDGYADVASELSPEDGDAVVATRLGSAKGLSANVRTITEKSVGVPPNQNNGFGNSLALTDLNGDGRAELITGIPGLDDFAGAVAVTPGTASGIDASGTKLIKASTFGLGAGARFGTLPR